MKKIFLSVFFLLMSSISVFAQTEPLKGEVSFDWITKSQIERDENIAKIREEIFTDDVVLKYSKKDFRAAFKDKLKDDDYMTNYLEIAQGKKEDAERTYCAFYWKQYLVSYGIQYKANPKENYYYDSMGNLKWIDIYQGSYPKFPYHTLQYNVNGTLKAVYYYLSDYDQYIYDKNGKFKGRWYKDKMYDKKAKVIMTRSTW